MMIISHCADLFVKLVKVSANDGNFDAEEGHAQSSEESRS